jgi:nucleoside-diphosphate-sugar epimerase
MSSFVIGATGKIGSYIVKHLVEAGEAPFALSRVQRSTEGASWIQGDLKRPEMISAPSVDTLYCTANCKLFSLALPLLYRPGLKRVIVFTTTSIATKLSSDIDAERDMLEGYVAAEESIKAFCEARGVEWTILRPTLVYLEGRDLNITRMSRTIRKLGFMPLSGKASGLRQPVHAEDLAMGAIAAASTPAAANKTYALPGGETLTYREMVGRVFDGMNRPRRLISLPPALWRFAFMLVHRFYRGFNVAMGDRMSKDMTFDASDAVRDFGWKPREFRPKF